MQCYFSGYTKKYQNSTKILYLNISLSHYYKVKIIAQRLPKTIFNKTSNIKIVSYTRRQ